MTRTGTSLLAGVSLACVAAMGSARAEDSGCSKVTAEALKVPGLTLTGSKLQEAADGLPRHCILSGKVNERTGVDGHAYAIQFEIRLPETWNGRFLHQVNGGNDGVVVPALGDKADGLVSGGVTPLARGFAVLSSDSGHSGNDLANKPRGLAAGSAFGLDPQARRDYGYSADITLAPIAKAIIAEHYGKKPDYSYIAGCSNGGRHTMVAAERMPEQYDGFLVGNPGFNLPRAAVQHAWDVQALTKADADIRKSITREDAKLISSKIIELCDGLDGAKDGLTANLKACQKAFNFDSLRCAAGTTEACLPAAKVDALKKVFAGPQNSKGEQLYSDWPVDGGVGTGNWRAWKVESPVAPWNNLPIIATMGGASLNYIFSTPPVEVDGSPDKLVEKLQAYDFDKDAPKIYAKEGPFTESAMDFMAPPAVDNPTLPAFQNGARKMLIYHGQADPVFSVNDTIRWYEKLNANVQGKADGFARLFALPGETHCGGGVTLEKFDALGALMDWVEKGKAPEAITASVNAANKELPTTWSQQRSRPLCPWPKFAKYVSGDVEQASSFTCAAE
ncbi:putative feruloyl esterase [Bradyrhizobium sp. ORS 285]|uniref:tannase/feruloyl esterase family alpha/beta hydrolase n=1 Tax=Bradyrhizobium sp. ORS 285 TaxID=115808 RepID=UPI000240A042|nr:tannase/feruloyl esterase family alpha/beta hydrolase [Bradyrhizobium sp. ORS 285]CCD87001.1 putative feruloyl esterase [Bradyrhizobium sp. ORS 285]SMX57684.1 putative feruloyl esterase [Bradyrhizobium sp. ORS 285]